MSEEVVRVRTVIFYDTGDVSIEYIAPSADVYRNGLTFNHTVLLPADSYDEELFTLRQAVKQTVAKAISDAARADNPTVVAVETDPDEIGPYEYAPGEGPRTEE